MGWKSYRTDFSNSYQHLKKSVVYLTFNDQPGGIFTSQVVGVCEFLRDELKCNVTLISFISLRNFGAVSKKIKQQWPGAVVLPMWPGIQRWRKNSFLLKRKLRKINPDVVFARGPFATVLARTSTFARVCFDARGAYTAEFGEYSVGGASLSSDEVKNVEADAIRSSDCAIAVSEALTEYWRRDFNYKDKKHVVIPCTLAKRVAVAHRDRSGGAKKIVFSGGNGKWQSLELISEILLPYFKSDPQVELLMLVNELPEKFPIAEAFPDRVTQKWVNESDVSTLLAQCDYGWMVRADSVTNQVASPVKFAEYLAAGLSVLISPKLGDFSEFVASKKCGLIVNGVLENLEPVDSQTKLRNADLADEFFRKQKYVNEYLFCLG